jgi:RecA/RadA recombinase
MNKIDSLVKDLLKVSDSEYGSVAADGTLSTVNEYYSTGVYLLNAQISGDIYKGIPGGKTIILAGDPSTGKTLYALSIGQHFLKEHPKGILVYADSEHAVDQKMFEDRGMDTNRILYMPVDTIENWRTQVVKMLKKLNEEEDVKAMFITDSISKMTSNKELNDISEGIEKSDMTKQKAIKASFRVFGLLMAKHNITHIANAHVYASMSFIPTKVVSGGSGALYEGSYVVMLSKAQLKEGTDVVGGIITSKLEKARFTKEKTKVKTLLSFTRGLHPYFGLPQFCVEHGIWEKVGNKYKVSEEVMVFEKEILKHSKKYFTKELMDKINAQCKKVFCFGNEDQDTFEEEEEVNKDQPKVEVKEVKKTKKKDK